MHLEKSNSIKFKMAVYRPLFTFTWPISRMHLEKFQVDKIQNGRPSAIIHLDRPDIAEYHENRSR